MRKVSSAILLLASAAIPGCRAPAAEPDPFAELPVWSFEASPDLVIGSAEGDVIVSVADVAALSDGRIVVQDNGDFSVKCFDPDGRLLWKTGRRGRGPGEFERIDWDGLAIAGDTIVVWDGDLKRVTWISPDGEYIGSAEMRTPAQVRRPLLTATGQRVVAQLDTHRFPRNRFGLVRDTAVVLAIGLAGDTALLMQRPGQEYAIVEGPNGRPGAWGERAGMNGLRGAGREGTFYLGVTDSPVVHRYAIDGTRTGEIRWHARRVPVGDSIRKLELAWADTLPDAAALRQRIERSFRRGEYPEYLPVFNRVLVDDEGNVWIRPYVHLPRAPVRWMVFDSTGTPLATAELPRDAKNIRNGSVLTRWNDEFDVAFVRRHRLKR
jgi:hypothetical protein